MIRLAILTVTVGSLALMTGCAHTYQLESDPLATPAYSSAERFQNWQRTTDMDFKEMNEDIDNVLFLSKPSQLSVWNIR
jgi:hypothetical protein